MSDVSDRVASLSPKERAALAMRLRRKTQTDESTSNDVIVRRANDGPAPLSFAQQRLWFLAHVEGGNSTYNLPITYELCGPLDVPVLERSFNEVIRRHEALRATFTILNEEPVQVFMPALTITLPVVDLTRYAESDRWAELQRLADENAQQPFDFERGPLVRAMLLKLSAERHYLAIVLHHIIGDAWSMGVLINELSVLYHAFNAGLPSPLPEPAIQYADFAVWQRESLEGAALRKQLDYWKKKLGGTLPVLQLPTDHARPPVQTHRGAYQYLELPGHLTSQVKELCKSEGLTLFMALLAAFDVLLYRYTGQTDILIGTPVADRNRPEVESLIGLFLNPIVLRNDLSGNPTFRQLLGRVREMMLEAHANQDVPFEKLVSELRPERNAAYSPLFQVMFLLQNAPMEVHIPSSDLNMSFSELTADVGATKFDLTLSMEEAGDGMLSYWEYKTDLFEDATIARMFRHFSVLLADLVAHPDKRISDASILEEDERRQLLVEWNDTAKTYPQRELIHQFIEQQAERSPSSIALVFEDTRLSYLQLNSRANQLAAHLRRLGVRPERKVAVLMHRSVEMVVSLLAVLKAGGAYLPLEPHYPRQRLRIMLDDAHATVLLTQGALRDKVGDYEGEAVCVDEEWTTIAGYAQENVPTQVWEQNPAYLIYTSGSTGRPKGVVNTHAAIRNRLLWMQDVYELTPDDRVLQKTPFGFDVSVWEFFWPLMFGATLVTARPGGHQDSRYLTEIIVEQGVTLLHFVPSMLSVFVEEEGVERCRSVRQIISSGEALNAALVRRLHERLWWAELDNLYGPTEAAVDVTRWRCERGTEEISIGRPIANIEIRILDERGEMVPVGVAGELHIAGVGLARGYEGRADLTAEKFVPDALSGRAGSRRYRTGDMGRYLADGTIEYLGRIDYQVKVRGFRIEPGEIEAALVSHAAVRDAAVIAHEEASGEKRLIAYVVWAGELSPQTSGLREYLKERLPEYMIPSVFVALDALPLTSSGKVDRARLPSPDGARPELRHGYIAPRTRLEKMLAEMWQSILRVAEVGIHDNFFELGGDSIQAAIFINSLQKKLDAVVYVVALFDAPDIAALVAYLNRHYTDAAARVNGGELTEAKTAAPSAHKELMPMRAAPRDGNRRQFPLSFAQQRLWFIDRLTLDSPFYNIPEALRLTGDLDVAALERSLCEIVRRHEALRTSFTTDGGQAVQVVNDALPLKLKVTDLSVLNETERELEALRLTAEEANRPFDLSTAPLTRAELLRLDAREHILLVTTHHIVSDGWSIGIFIRELATLYGAFLKGEPSPLPELPVQYADFTVWQREWLQGDVLEEQLSYWMRQLDGELPVLNLPTDRPRPPQLSYKGADRHLELSASLTEQLKTLGRRESVTPFMTLLAAFNVLLYRYTGQEDIVVGTPIAGRNRSELENLIGFFVNTLVIRTDLSGRLSFRELLGRIREVTLGAYAHQDLPFEKLVEELKPERDMSRNPIFQVMFALQNAPLEEFELPGLQLGSINAANDATRFDIEFHMWEGDGTLTGSLIYNIELFDAATITQLLGHFRNLLDAVVADPEAQVSNLPLLTEAQRRQLLVEWNDTHSDYPRNVCIHQLFEEQAARMPDGVAVVSEDVRITYDELNRKANRVARRLRHSGVGPESRVGICLERGPEMVSALLGVLKAGGAYVPLDLDYPKPRLQFMLEDAGVRVLLTERRQLGALPASGVEVICLDTDRAEIEAESAENLPYEAAPDNLAYVIYTSGSTGRPKGVCIDHRAVNRLVLQTNYVRLSASDHVAQASNASFDAATFEIWGALLHGAQLNIIARDVALSPHEFAAQIKAQGITVLFLTTALFNQLARVVPDCFAPLRSLLFGGEAVDPRWVREVTAKGAPARLLHVYGPTENTTFSTWHQVGEVAETAQTVPIGDPLMNTQAYVLDAGFNPVPVGVAGELCLGGEGLMRGYLNRPELTAEKLLPNPFGAEPGARLYRTGDLVRFLRDGSIEFAGRIDQQVKMRGFRIEPGEIEAALVEHPAVRECVVTAREDQPGERRLVAYVVGRTDYDAAGEEEAGGDLRADQVVHWQKIFDDHIYSEPSTQADPSFNIIGWNSNYTDAPLPAEEMRVWLEDTLEPVRAAKPPRVLEIGCGTGLLLARLAPACEHYLGTDVSKVALDYIRAQVLGATENSASVSLRQCAADDFDGIEPQSFDSVILNSVVQYFPDVDYLLRVLEGATETVAPGGFIYVGDVRSLPLLESFHASVQLFKAQPSLPIAQLREHVRTRVAQENELAVDPAFFFALKQRLPRISRVEVRPKRGPYHNELTRFRYQVMIHIGGAPETSTGALTWLDWDAEGLTLDALRSLLAARQPATLALTHVPNARLSAEVKTLELLSNDDGTHTAGELRRIVAEHGAGGIDPEDLYVLGRELSYGVDIGWARHDADGRFDVLFTAAGQDTHAAFPAPGLNGKGWNDYANNPLRQAVSRHLAPQLRSHLQERLPEYMVPSAFVMLDALPLNANGKVNRRALPAPDMMRPELAGNFVAPRNAVEEKVAAIWCQVLGIKQVGVSDNFFDLGGHSLVATQVISRLCDAFEMELPLRCLFDAPTVEGLSVAVVQRRAAQADDELLARALGELEQLSEEEVRALLAHNRQ